MSEGNPDRARRLAANKTASVPVLGVAIEALAAESETTQNAMVAAAAPVAAAVTGAPAPQKTLAIPPLAAQGGILQTGVAPLRKRAQEPVRDGVRSSS